MDNFDTSIKQYVQKVRAANATTVAQASTTMTNAMNAHATGITNANAGGSGIQMYAKKWGTAAEKDVIEPLVRDYVGKYKANVRSVDPINDPDNVGVKTVFKNGQSIIDVVNSNGEYVLNVSEGLLDSVIEEIDTNGSKTDYVKV
jgi:hypothetical protein